MRLGPRSVVATLVLVTFASGCALVSGLSGLDLDEGTDASIESGGPLDSSMDGARDRGAPPLPDVVQPPPDALASDAPSDAPVSDAGAVIQCGTSTCPTTDVCCNHLQNGKSTFTCGAAGACKGNADYVMACDALSCGAGKRCCVTLTFNGGTVATAASCAANCTTSLPLCRSDAGDASPPCNFGFTCQPHTQLVGYEACSF